MTLDDVASGQALMLYIVRELCTPDCEDRSKVDGKRARTFARRSDGRPAIMVPISTETKKTNGITGHSPPTISIVGFSSREREFFRFARSPAWRTPPVRLVSRVERWRDFPSEFSDPVNFRRRPVRIVFAFLYLRKTNCRSAPYKIWKVNILSQSTKIFFGNERF